MSGFSLGAVVRSSVSAALSSVTSNLPSPVKIVAAGVTALVVAHFRDSWLLGILGGAAFLVAGRVKRYLPFPSASMQIRTVPITPQNFAEEVQHLCEQVGSYNLNSANKAKAIARFNEILKVNVNDLNAGSKIIKQAQERCFALKNYLENGKIDDVMLPFLTAGLIKAFSEGLIPEIFIIWKYNAYYAANKNNLGETAELIANNLREVYRLVQRLPLAPLNDASQGTPVPNLSSNSAENFIPPLPIAHTARAGLTQTQVPVPATNPNGGGLTPARRHVVSTVPTRTSSSSAPKTTPAPIVHFSYLTNEIERQLGVPVKKLSRAVRLPPVFGGAGPSREGSSSSASVRAPTQPAAALRTDPSVSPAAREPNSAAQSQSSGGAAHPAAAGSVVLRRDRAYLESAQFKQDVKNAEARAKPPKPGTKISLNVYDAVINEQGIAVVVKSKPSTSEPKLDAYSQRFLDAYSRQFGLGVNPNAGRAAPSAPPTLSHAVVDAQPATPAAVPATAASASPTPSHAVVDAQPARPASVPATAASASAAPKKARDLHVQESGLFD